MKISKLVPFAAILIVAAAAHADIVHLKDGRKVEGEVVEKNASKVVVKTKLGTSEFNSADVDHIEAKKTPEQELAAKRATIDPKNADQLWDLFVFAKEQKLVAKSKDILKEIIKVNPDHENARKELGFTKVDGKWVSEADAKKAPAAAGAGSSASGESDADMKAKGMVQYKGKWMTPEAKEAAEHAEKGEVLIDGQWVNKKEKDKAEAEAKLREETKEHKLKGEYLVDGKWLPKADAEKFYANISTPYRAEGEHVMILTDKGIDLGERVLIEAERAYRDCAGFVGGEPQLHGKLMPVYITANVEESNQLANSLGGDVKTSNYYAWCTPWLPQNPDGFDMVSVSMYYRDKQNKDVLTDIFARHALAEQYVQRLVGKDATDVPPAWFVDGFACYIERWNNPKYFNWSRDVLRQKGALTGLKVFVGSYTVSEQSILQAGLVVAYLKSDKVKPEVKTAFDDVLTALKNKGKIGKAFKKLEKALIAAEDTFNDFAETKQQG